MWKRLPYSSSRAGNSNIEKLVLTDSTDKVENDFVRFTHDKTGINDDKRTYHQWFWPTIWRQKLFCHHFYDLYEILIVAFGGDHVQLIFHYMSIYWTCHKFLTNQSLHMQWLASVYFRPLYSWNQPHRLHDVARTSMQKAIQLKIRNIQQEIYVLQWLDVSAPSVEALMCH